MRLNARVLVRGGACVVVAIGLVSAAHAGLFHHKPKVVDAAPPVVSAPPVPVETAPPSATGADVQQYDDVGYAGVGSGEGVTLTHASL
ncbi:MAG: hypothetical protein KGJ05_10450, partial [Alphaproteobacteria bacterium]|nr:hypothetical protein [Alphaproteobacteria bacterium]